MEYNVKVESTSPIQRKLNVRVPASVVQKHFELGLVEAQKTARLKGFRPGMVPLPVVKQYYAAEIKHQVFHNLINDSYREALRDQKIRAVGSPQIETPEHATGQGAHDHTIGDGQDLVFTATVEVLPEIQVKGYTGIPLTREKAEVTDGDIEKVMASFLDSHAELVPVSRSVKKGDFVDMIFVGGLVTDKGIEKKPGMEGTRVLEVGSDSLIPGFEENLVGMSSGETKTFRVPFPADFYEKEFAGKDSEFTVTIKEVKEKKVPALDDEFAKTMGYENLGDMRAKAREHLTRERGQEVDRKLRSDLLQALIEKNSFEVPASLVQAQTRTLAQDVAQNLKQQGFTDQMVQEALASELENLRKRADNQVRASLLLESIAEKEGLKLTEADIDAEIKKMAENMKADEQKIREFYAQNPARRDDLEFRLREDRAVQFLLEKSKIK